MKFNGSSTFYIMNKNTANKTRLDAFEKMINSRLSESEERAYECINGLKVDMISTYHNFDDSKLILRELITRTGLIGVDIILVTFQTVFRGDSVRTAYKTAYTCGVSVKTHPIFDLEPKGHTKIDLIDTLTKSLDLSPELNEVITELHSKGLLAPLYKAKIGRKYKAIR